jgi:GNAT superfamily N-acetyltransferase
MIQEIIIGSNICTVDFLAIEDVDDIAELHVRALPNDLLPQFGHEIVREYYKNSFKMSDGFIVGTRMGSKLLGFTYLSLGKNSFLRLIKCQLLRSFFYYAIKALLNKPMYLLDILVSLISTKKNKKYQSEIAYIATLPEFHGNGIGKEMLNTVSLVALEIGIDTCFTKTLSNNTHVIRMYTKLFSNTKKIGFFSDTSRSYTILGWNFSARNVM